MPNGGRDARPTSKLLRMESAPLTTQAPSPASRDDLLRSYLADADEPCPRCGYNLRQLHSSRCPECGSELTLVLGLTEPRLAAYLTTVGVWCFGLGASTFLSVIALAFAPMSWWSNAGGMFLLVLLGISALSLTLSIRRRTAMRKQKESVQWLVAGISAGIVVFLGFLILINFHN